MNPYDPIADRRKLRHAMWAAVAILLIVLGTKVAVQLYTGGIRSEVHRHLELRRALDEIYDAVEEAETGQRGYLLTGREVYLGPIHDARNRAMSGVGKIEALSTGTPFDRNRFGVLPPLLDQKFTWFQVTVEAYRAGGRVGVVALADQDGGEELTDRIRSICDELQAEWVTEVDELRGRVDWLFTLSSALGLLSIFALIAIVYYLFRRLSSLVTRLTQTLNDREREIQQRKEADRERVKLIKSLKSKNKELDHFAHIASHDLQEPLRTVSNFIELIEEEYSDKMGDDWRTYMTFINQAVDQMRLFIKHLVRYSQIGRDSEKTRVDLNLSARNALRNLDPAATESGADVQIDPLPTVIGHPTELTQLLQNLLGNAIKFAAAERTPVIRISCNNDSTYHHIHVTDNGIGIDKRTRAKIFNMFSRIHDGDEYQDHGIGLTFCRRIVETHGGELTLTSTPGEGSTFSFTLARTRNETEIEKSSINR